MGICGLVLSAVQPECEFQTAAQGCRTQIHATKPRYAEATTVENRRTSPRPDTRSNRSSKRSIQSIYNCASCSSCTITLLVHSNLIDAEHRQETVSHTFDICHNYTRPHPHGETDTVPRIQKNDRECMSDPTFAQSGCLASMQA